MLARRHIPKSYHQWNRKWGAPSGRRWFRLLPFRAKLKRWFPRIPGPFAYQINNTTRRFEYPWAFFAAPLSSKLNVLEIGGGLAGFQFVLSRLGIKVVNVDPAEAAEGRGWPVTPEQIERLNRSFGTSVRLVNCFLEEADLRPRSFDRIFAISTLEHIPEHQVDPIVAKNPSREPIKPQRRRHRGNATAGISPPDWVASSG